VVVCTIFVVQSNSRLASNASSLSALVGQKLSHEGSETMYWFTLLFGEGSSSPSSDLLQLVKKRNNTTTNDIDTTNGFFPLDEKLPEDRFFMIEILVLNV
jgi:hypothetical protein